MVAMSAVAVLTLANLIYHMNPALKPVQPDVMNQQVTVNVNVSPKQIKHELSTAKELIEKLSIAAWPSSIGNFISGQRYFIAAGTVLGGYVLLCRECVRANQYVVCNETWGSWHNDYPHEVFMSMSHQEIAKELVIEIQRRYSNIKNPTDFIGPLITFAKSIDSEIKLVDHYLWLHSILQRSHLNMIVPLNIEACVLLPKMMQRLRHIKNIFLTWAADYKIEHNSRSSTICSFC